MVTTPSRAIWPSYACRLSLLTCRAAEIQQMGYKVLVSEGWSSKRPLPCRARSVVEWGERRLCRRGERRAQETARGYAALKRPAALATLTLPSYHIGRIVLSVN